MFFWSFIDLTILAPAKSNSYSLIDDVSIYSFHSLESDLIKGFTPSESVFRTYLDPMPEFFEEALKNKDYKKMVLMNFIDNVINLHELDSEKIIRATYALFDFKYQLIEFLVPTIFEHYQSKVTELNAKQKNGF